MACCCSVGFWGGKKTSIKTLCDPFGDLSGLSLYRFEENYEVGPLEWRYKDECGNYHAEFYNTGLVPGKDGLAVITQGTAGWFNVGRNFINGANGWSVSFWAKDQQAAEDSTFFSTSNLGSANSFILDTSYVMFWDNTGTPKAVPYGDLSPTVFAHIVISFNPSAGTLQAWRDGVLQGTAVFAPGQRPTQPFIGSWFIRDDGTGAYKAYGELDHLRIFGRPLVQSEVDILFAELD